MRPDYPRAYNNRGVVYRAMGDLERALADYTEAIRLEPKYADAYANRATVRKRLGDEAQAAADQAEAERLREHRG